MCITSSPNFPQANGKVELAVQTVKNFIKKESDPYKALKAGRGTSLESGLSPAETSDGKTRTMLLSRAVKGEGFCTKIQTEQEF